MPSKKKSIKPTVNKELEGFSIEINPLGEISSNFPVERINEFLNKHVQDRKINEGDESADESSKESGEKSTEESTGKSGE